MAGWIHAAYITSGLQVNVYTYKMVQHYRTVKEPPPLQKDKWSHIVWTWDINEEELILYVNGEETGSATINKGDSWDGPPAGTDLSQGKISIGGGKYGAPAGSAKDPAQILPLPDNFRFTLDEVRIYNRPLTAVEVQDLFRNP